MKRDAREKLGIATRAIHVGQEPDPVSGATIPPISISTTFTQASPGAHKGFEYSRSGNPTRDGLEACIASLEGGVGCTSLASGSSGTATLLLMLQPGDKVLAYADVYGGTFRMMKYVMEGWGLVPVFTDDPTIDGFKAQMQDGVKMLWCETPSNPLVRCLDIKALADLAHENGATLVVDNTFATPALQIPIALGADFALHSTTKYIGGHSDVVGGAIVAKSEQALERLRFLQNSVGAVPGPIDCYLQQRGLKTLALRMERHCANAAKVAAHLKKSAKLEKVMFPFDEDHPDVEIARRQMKGGGGIVSISFKSGWDGARAFCENVKVFSCAESLGGVESLANHPAIMTHASIPKELREARGVTDGLVRLSVGIEDIDDLLADLDQAIAAV